MERSLATRGIGFIYTPHTSLSKDRACDLELTLIKELRPKFNLQGNGAANAGRGSQSCRAKLSTERVQQIRHDLTTYTGSLRSYHREYVPEVCFSSFLRLSKGISYKEEAF